MMGARACSACRPAPAMSTRTSLILAVIEIHGRAVRHSHKQTHAAHRLQYGWRSCFKSSPLVSTTFCLDKHLVVASRDFPWWFRAVLKEC